MSIKSKIKNIVLGNKQILRVIYPVVRPVRRWAVYKKYSYLLKKAKETGDKCIFYFGIPVHNNLGDLAQGVCIRRWICKNFPDYGIIEIETNAVVNTPFSIINKIKKVFDIERDYIIFQSGYTTTDLGGHADFMHQSVIKAFPNARILMMPQTVYFQSEQRRKLCSQIYNSAKNMIFLARDSVSFNEAKKMFPDIRVMEFPDIVTTMIGQYEFNYDREGIMFCVRNDSEKYYTDEEINMLMDKCREIGQVFKSDTTKVNCPDIVENAEEYVVNEIDNFAHYKLVITDRYHGTILSLAAGTPVIIIKTTDHKVVTGAEWFKGVYHDDSVSVADNLEHAFQLAKKILSKDICYGLNPFFKNKYYDKLKELFERRG